MKEALEEMELSGNELDRRILQGSGYTSRLIKGEKFQPDATIISRIANELDVTSDWIMTGRGPKRPRDHSELSLAQRSVEWPPRMSEDERAAIVREVSSSAFAKEVRPQGVDGWAAAFASRIAQYKKKAVATRVVRDE